MAELRKLTKATKKVKRLSFTKVRWMIIGLSIVIGLGIFVAINTPGIGGVASSFLIVVIGVVFLGLFSILLMNRMLKRSLSATISDLGEEVFEWINIDLNKMRGSDSLEKLENGFKRVVEETSKLAISGSEKEQLQKQITELLTIVSTAADGDFTVHAEVTADALGALADSFNLMIEELGDLIREVKNAAAQVEQSTEEVERSTDKMVEGAETQSQQISNTLTAVAEMSESIQQVSENANSAAEAAQTASEVAMSGVGTVDKMVQGMHLMRDTVQSTAGRIRNLGESSDEIGDIVEVIESIADQTNLLALNATIEAARAGDAGKGFAVVADEVRKLAERASKATKDIATLVQSIQSETNEAVTAMKLGTEEVEKGTNLADEAGESLKKILDVVKNSSELIQQISLAAKRQAKGSGGIVDTMKEISEIARQTSEGAKQMATYMEELAAVSGKLTQSVARFQLTE